MKILSKTWFQDWFQILVLNNIKRVTEKIEVVCFILIFIIISPPSSLTCDFWGHRLWCRAATKKLGSMTGRLLIGKVEKGDGLTGAARCHRPRPATPGSHQQSPLTHGRLPFSQLNRIKMIEFATNKISRIIWKSGWETFPVGSFFSADPRLWFWFPD